MTYYVPFKKYFPPDGRHTMVNWPTERSDVHAKAMSIIDAGFHFEYEVLSTGMHSRTIGDGNGDYVYCITPDDLAEAMEHQIMKADISLMLAQSQLNGDIE